MDQFLLELDLTPSDHLETTPMLVHKAPLGQEEVVQAETSVESRTTMNFLPQYVNNQPWERGPHDDYEMETDI